MSILVIGQSAFLASKLPEVEETLGWHYIGHKPALDPHNWPEEVETVINFSCDPIVKEGKFSDLDHQFAKIAQTKGAAYVMLSSRAVYGITNKPVTLSENHKSFEIITPYGHAKKLIEQDLMKNFNHVTILRLSNIFGFEYDKTSSRPTFMGTLLKSLKEEGVIKFSMNPMTQRDFLPLESFSRQLALIARNPQTGVYNLGSGFGTPTGDLASWILEGYGTGKLVAERKDILDSFVLDMTKTRTAYKLDKISAETIKRACLKIGQQLKKT